jgi:hypothetical protein
MTVLLTIVGPVYAADPNHSGVDPTGHAEKGKAKEGFGVFFVDQTAMDFLCNQPRLQNVASFQYLFDPSHDNLY